MWALFSVFWRFHQQKTGWWWKPSQWDLNCARRTMCSLWYEVINSVILQWTDRNQDTFFFWVIAVCSGTIFQLPVLPSAFLLPFQLFISLLLCILQLGCELFFLPPPSPLITPASPSFLLMPGGRVRTERNKEKVYDCQRQSLGRSVSVAVRFANFVKLRFHLLSHRITLKPLILRQHWSPVDRVLQQLMLTAH